MGAQTTRRALFASAPAIALAAAGTTAIAASGSHADLYREAAECDWLRHIVNTEHRLIEQWEARERAFLDAVEALPQTPDNIAIKARALNVLYDGDVRDIGEYLASRLGDTTDGRLARQIVLTLARGVR